MQGEGEPAGTLLGATLGPYHVTAQIGRGGMGAVYRAVDKRLGRHVAIKSLLHEGADPRGRKRLMDEARRASRVASPYVATVYDVVEDGDRCYIVMEAIEGRRLDTVIWDEHPDNDRLTRYAAEIAEALSAIHAAGIVHRDLKPANVMITTTNHVKVMDFGLAQDDPTAWLEGATSGRIPSTTQSAPGTIAGTIAYMSPEQIRGEKLDGRSDLFSFGTVLHEAITGLHPFQRDSILATASAILNDPPEPPPEPAALASHALLGVAGRLLEKDREKRYPSAEHVRADLAVLAGRSPQRRRRWLPWAAAAAALAIGIATWTLWPAPKPTGARPVVAILPFEDRTGEAKGDLRAALMADVLAASLADSDRVRPLGSDRVREIVAGLPPRSPQSRVIEAVAGAVPVRWIVTGSVFKEGDAYYASISAFAPGSTDPIGTYRVSAAGGAAMGERGGAILRDKLFHDRESQGAALWRSASDEAQLLEQEARVAIRELRYRDAIEKLE
ncbi:MAG TPA: serine/threonine-protein kinase, partial [Candidatus Bathyarchaeia archaeon]|nr:serine/threonine-protein kinase [Candidatus Bathyarchaeia archaeon]